MIGYAPIPAFIVKSDFFYALAEKSFVILKSFLLKPAALVVPPTKPCPNCLLLCVLLPESWMEGNNELFVYS